ncbi:MAG: hypothetical protein Q9169_003518 [Polycauliona sp. 2 TL-2023]
MATTNATFEFICRTAQHQKHHLTFVHPVPTALCVEPMTEDLNAQLKAALNPIIHSHDAEILSVSEKTCVNCPNPAATVNPKPAAVDVLK